MNPSPPRLNPKAQGLGAPRAPTPRSAKAGRAAVPPAGWAARSLDSSLSDRMEERGAAPLAADVSRAGAGGAGGGAGAGLAIEEVRPMLGAPPGPPDPTAADNLRARRAELQVRKKQCIYLMGADTCRCPHRRTAFLL